MPTLVNENEGELVLKSIIQTKKILRYCAFCRHPHRIYDRKGVGTIFALSALFLSLCLSFGFWGRLSGKVIPLFFILLLTGELVFHLRWRLALICRQCGFDPLIYQKSRDKAAMKVKEYLDRRRRDPAFLLAPPLNIPVKRKPRVQKRSESEADR